MMKQSIARTSVPPDSRASKLMSEKEAAELLGYTIRALQNWRLRGGGPTFVKVSARSIRYRPDDLNSWIDERLRSSTSDLGPIIDHSKPGTSPDLVISKT